METVSLIPRFLDACEIARSCPEASLDEAAIQTLLDLAQRISADPDLCSLSSTVHHLVFETTEDYMAAISRADAAFGAEADLLHALFVLDSMRLVREKQQARGVPGEIGRAVNQRHAVAWLNHAIATHGHVGISDWIPGWMRTIGSGELYRLGRLEFILRAWDYPFRVYANSQTNEVIVLPEAGQHFTQDGYLAGKTSWTSSLLETDDAVLGIPISPGGYALPQAVSLSRSEWHMVLGEGDPVLDMHVPGEGALTLDSLHNALRQAEVFLTTTTRSVHLWPMRVIPGSSARRSKPCSRRSRTSCAGSMRAICFQPMTTRVHFCCSHSVQRRSSWQRHRRTPG